MSNQLKLKKSPVGGWEVYYRDGYLHVPGDNLTKTKAAFQAIGVISQKTGEAPELIAANIADNVVKAEILSHFNNMRKSMGASPSAPPGMVNYGAPAPAPMAVPQPQQYYPPQPQPYYPQQPQPMPNVAASPEQLKTLRAVYCQRVFDIIEPMSEELRKTSIEDPAAQTGAMERKMETLAGLVSRIDISDYATLVYSDWGRALASGDVDLAAAIHKRNADSVKSAGQQGNQIPMIDPNMFIPR